MMPAQKLDLREVDINIQGHISVFVSDMFVSPGCVEMRKWIGTILLSPPGHYCKEMMLMAVSCCTVPKA